VIVSTADPFHHGIGYGDPSERALAPDDGGSVRSFARAGTRSAGSAPSWRSGSIGVPSRSGY
jgi:hypothetical protein